MSYIQLNDLTVPGGDDGRVIAAKAILDTIVNGHIKTVAKNAGGSSYAVGDIIQLNTGTAVSGWKAEFLVLTVSSGAVLTLAIRSAGVYSTLPVQTTTGQATTALTGTGTGCTVDLTVEGPFEAITVVGGASYAVGDTIEVDGGTGGSTDPSFVVTSVSSGAVTGLAPLGMGNRTTPVDTSVTPAATTKLTGSGNNALTVSYNQIGWRQIASSYTNGTTDFEWWARGTNLVGSHPYCGLKSVLSTTSYIQIRTAEAYSGAATFDTQTGTWADGADTGVAKWVAIPTTETASFSLFIYVSGRVVNFVLSDDNSYELGVMGMFIPFTDSPSTTFLVPFIAGGTICNNSRTISSVADAEQLGGSTAFIHSSIMHAGSDDLSSSNIVPYRIRSPIGVWAIARRGGTADGYKIWPYNTLSDLQNEVYAPDLQGSSSTIPQNSVTSIALVELSAIDGWFNEDSTAAGSPGVSPLGASGQMHWQVPAIILSDFAGDGVKVHGQLEGLSYISGRGLNDEDRVTDLQGRRWIVLPDTVTNALSRRFALLEG